MIIYGVHSYVTWYKEGTEKRRWRAAELDG